MLLLLFADCYLFTLLIRKRTNKVLIKIKMCKETVDINKGKSYKIELFLLTTKQNTELNYSLIIELEIIYF